MISAKNRLIKTLSVVIMFILTAISLWDGSAQIMHYGRIQLAEQLGDLATSTSHSIRMYFQSLLQFGENITPFIADNMTIDSPVVMSTLSEVIEQSEAYEISLTRPDGTYTTSSGYKGTLEGMTFEDILDNGKKCISNVTDMTIGGETRHTIVLSTPIERNGELLGVMSCLYDIRSLSTLLAPSYYWDTGYFHVFQPDGQFVMLSPAVDPALISTSMLDIKAKMNSASSSEDFRDDIANGRSDMISYTAADGTGMSAYYTPVGINDWYLMIALPESTIYQLISENRTILFIASLKLLVIFAAFMTIFAINSRRESTMLKDQLADSSEISQKQKIALDSSGMPPFEFDMRALEAHNLDIHDTSNAWFMERILSPDHSGEIVDPDQESAYLKLCDMMLSARGMLCGDFRLRTAPDAPYRMYRVTLSVPEHNDDDDTVHTIVSLTDIDDIGHRMSELRLRAVQDEITGMDTYSELRIKSAARLNRANHHFGAMVFIRADNFDAVCDATPEISHIHLIKTCANLISESLGECDVFARSMGCEFWVFSGDVTCADLVQKGISRLFKADIASGTERLTFSCGIAQADPEDDIHSLMHRAYAAGQLAHREGGNRLQHG